MDKKRTTYLNGWQREHKDRINYLVDKGFKAKIQAAAIAAGQSVSAYITQAVRERMEGDALARSDGAGED